MMKHASIITITAATLMACATPTMSDEPAVPSAANDTCGAAQYAALIGKPVTSPGVPVPSRTVRHIWPNTIVTMDMAPARLNVMISAEGIITALRCY